MFYSCENLNFINISSFKMNSTNTSLFDENLPESGTLIINGIFEPIVKNQIPENWKIIIE